MKQKFIKFLKDKHALKEFLIEIVPISLDDLNEQFSDGGAEFVLCDGAIFFYKNTRTKINWMQLNKEWLEVMKEEEAL